MSAKTQLSPLGIAQRRYGTLGHGSRYSGRLTQLSPLGVPWRRYGTLGHGSRPAYALTRLGSLGVPWSRFAGDFTRFPQQYLGLQYARSGVIYDLCLVAEGAGNYGIGGVLQLVKNGTVYDVYLVLPSDTNASPLQLETPSGVLSVRKYT